MSGEPEPALSPLPPLRGETAYQLDVSRVIGQTFKVTIANLLPFSLVGLAVYSPALLLHVIGALTPDYAVVFSGVAMILKGLLALVLTGALTFAVVQQLRDEPATMGEITQAGVESLGRVFVVGLLVGLASLVGLLLCVVPGIIVVCMYWVAVPVAVIERPGIRASLDRSAALTSGTRMAVFAVILLIGLITGGVSFVATAGLTGVASAFSDERPAGSLYSLTQLALSLVMLPFECLGAAAAAIGYHDLRVHREGADVDDLVRVFE